jgi:hypothetical protein
VDLTLFLLSLFYCPYHQTFLTTASSLSLSPSLSPPSYLSIPSLLFPLPLHPTSSRAEEEDRRAECHSEKRAGSCTARIEENECPHHTGSVDQLAGTPLQQAYLAALHCSVLYCTVLYVIALCCIVLHCTILYVRIINYIFLSPLTQPYPNPPHLSPPHPIPSSLTPPSLSAPRPPSSHSTLPHLAFYLSPHPTSSCLLSPLLSS